MDEAAWDELPAAAIAEIALLMPSVRDLLTMSLVCQSWRQVGAPLGGEMQPDGPLHASKTGLHPQHACT